jgi:hypothetical protein
VKGMALGIRESNQGKAEDKMAEEKQRPSTKGISFDGFNDYASARAIAISAGDLILLCQKRLGDSWDTLAASAYAQPRERPRPAVSRVC